MKTLLLKYWDTIRSSFWFIPSLMVAGAIFLSFAMVAIDRHVPAKWVAKIDWAYNGGAEGASAMLQTIAGSMITIAGVVFSLTLVALSLASSQFGPRLLRNFMRDTPNQVVLGTFVSTFLYCLLVLRTIRRADESVFVPHLSVTLGVLCAIWSLGVLIYFIHHVSVSIQADEIISRVHDELKAGIDRLFPSEIGRGKLPESNVVGSIKLPGEFAHEAVAITANADGYLQLIDTDVLMQLAEEFDLTVKIERRPGHYIVDGVALARVHPATSVSEELAGRVRAAFVLGQQRAAAQDLEFSVHQLVEIAVRALSPGINDPFTAISCVDRLTSALCQLASREIPSPDRADKSGRLRVIAPGFDFNGVADAAFNQIRQCARTNVGVTIRLLESIAVIAAAAHRVEERRALQRHADMIIRGARAALAEADDVRDADERYQQACAILREAD